MNYNIKKLYICTSLSCLILASCYYAKANAAMPNQTTPVKEIKGSITKEKINTGINSLLLKDLEQKVNINKEIFNDLNTDFSNIDIINVNTVKQPEPKVETQPAKTENTSDETNNADVHDVSFDELRDDSKIKENDTTYKGFVSSNNDLMTESNRKFLDNVRNLIASGETTQAEILLDQAMTNIKTDSWSLAEIASVYESFGKQSKAEHAYQKAVFANPNRIELLYNYALCLYKNNNLEKSKIYLTKITKINSQFTLAYYNLGNIYYKQKNLNMALKEFSKATEINPLCSDAYFNIAIILESMKYKKLALKYYSKYLDLEPKDLTAKRAVKRLSQS